MTGQGPTGYQQPYPPRPGPGQPPGPGWWMASDGLWYPPTATPYHGPPPGGSPTNGIGIAAMVLGIVGVAVGLVWVLAFAALVCGVLGIVFGIAGRGRAAKLRVPAGPAVSGLILGIVAIGLSGYGFYVQYRVVDTVSTLFNTSSVLADPTTNRMEITRCTTVAGSPIADGTLVNTSDETRSFRLYVSFRDANGYETSMVGAYTSRVAPHATETWTAYGNSSSQLASCAFVGDPNSGGASTPIDGTSTPATPGS